MKDYYNLTIRKNSDITLKLVNIESELQKASDEKRKIYIRIHSIKGLFELFIPPLIGYLKYYQSGVIDSYYVEEEKQKIIKENNFFSVINIKKPTTFLCSIESDQTLIVYSSLHIIGTFKGTLIFQNNEAIVIAKKMENAKIINCMGVFDKVCGTNKIIKGNENL